MCISQLVDGETVTEMRTAAASGVALKVSFSSHSNFTPFGHLRLHLFVVDGIIATARMDQMVAISLLCRAFFLAKSVCVSSVAVGMVD